MITVFENKTVQYFKKFQKLEFKRMHYQIISKLGELSCRKHIDLNRTDNDANAYYII